MIDNNKEYILCAAIRRKEPKDCQPYHNGQNDICGIEIGYRHHDIYQRFRDGSLSVNYPHLPNGRKGLERRR